jgi:hypothetical protein
MFFDIFVEDRSDMSLATDPFGRCASRKNRWTLDPGLMNKVSLIICERGPPFYAHHTIAREGSHFRRHER